MDWTPHESSLLDLVEVGRNMLFWKLVTCKLVRSNHVFCNQVCYSNIVWCSWEANKALYYVLFYFWGVISFIICYRVKSWKGIKKIKKKIDFFHFTYILLIFGVNIFYIVYFSLMYTMLLVCLINYFFILYYTLGNN